MSDFRLHLADLIDNPPVTIVTPPDIEQALEIWRKINSSVKTWARFDAMQFEHERVVNVIWGMIHSDGSHECAIQTIRFTLQSDGSVYVSRHTHS